LADLAETSLSTIGSDIEAVLVQDSDEDEGLVDAYNYLSFNSGNNGAVTAANPALGDDEVVLDSQPLPGVTSGVVPPKRIGSNAPLKKPVDPRLDQETPARTNAQWSPHATRAYTAMNPPTAQGPNESC
jgi:hypothetical protein